MIDPFTYWSRVVSSWQMMADTGERMAMTAIASGNVISARTDLMRSAAQSPMTADYAEFARMVPEKIAAFSAAGTVAADVLLKAHADGLAQASKAAARVRSGRMPMPVDIMGYWAGASLDMLLAMESGSRMGRDTLAPIHKTATANARRLSKGRTAA